VNPNKQKPARARGVPQPFAQRTTMPAQFKHPTVQAKNAAAAPSAKRPLAPPVYGQGETPKAAPPKLTKGTVSRKTPISPAVYRAEAKKV
jgi:hypothetical protein